MAVNFYTDINADSFVKEGGTSSQYLMADGSVTTGSGGSSPWSTDTNGITYTSGNVGIGMASEAALKLAVTGDARFYDDLRVNGNARIDLDLDVFGATSLGDDLSLDGNDILTEGGDIKDNNDATGTAGQFLSSKGSGLGVRWVSGVVTSDTTEGGTGSVVIGNMVKITQTAYDALGSKDADTLYFIVG